MRQTPIEQRLSRRDSVEVISDIELTSSEVETLHRRKKTGLASREKPLVSIVYRTKMIPPSRLETIKKEEVTWSRYHLIYNGGCLVFSNPHTFLLESKFNIQHCKIKEYRLHGKGSIILYNAQYSYIIRYTIQILLTVSKYLFRFKDRSERRKWLCRISKIKSPKSSINISLLSGTSDYSYNSDFSDYEIKSSNTSSMKKVKSQRNILSKLKKTFARRKSRATTTLNLV